MLNMLKWSFGFFTPPATGVPEKKPPLSFNQRISIVNQRLTAISCKLCSLPEMFCCALTFELMENPVVLNGYQHLIIDQSSLALCEKPQLDANGAALLNDEGQPLSELIHPCTREKVSSCVQHPIRQQQILRYIERLESISLLLEKLAYLKTTDDNIHFAVEDSIPVNTVGMMQLEKISNLFNLLETLKQELQLFIVELTKLLKNEDEDEQETIRVLKNPKKILAQVSRELNTLLPKQVETPWLNDYLAYQHNPLVRDCVNALFLPSPNLEKKEEAQAPNDASRIFFNFLKNQ